MNIHDLKGAEGAKTASKRVGRGIGSGTGKTSTRGHAPTSRAAKCL